MKTKRIIPTGPGRWLAVGAVLAMTSIANAQTTNWVAYNDHRPSTAPVANGWAITAPNVTGYNMGAAGDTEPSALTDFRTGSPLTATASWTGTGSPDDFGAVGRPVRSNTPVGNIFFGICDLVNDGLVGVRSSIPSFVTMTIAGLDPTKRYIFRGSVTRNGGYGNRWTAATIAANGWTDAHINGDGGPGVLTGNNFPASALNPGQAALNSGANNEGAVIGWNDIAPLEDGTFTITCAHYTNAIPGGVANGPYGYSFGAMALTEVEIVAPAITANPAASTTVEQNRPFSLSVAATGAPLNYQWYKDGGAIPSATFTTYSVAQAQVSDSGMYYAVVFNGLGRQTSTVAQVTVFADTTAPAVGTIFSYPTVDSLGNATLDQIIIEFNESVTSASVGDPFSYSVSGVGTPSAVIVTNSSTVVLVLAFPLAEDTDYSVTLSGATDGVGNVAGSSSAPFHTWVSGIGNGLIMESYNVAGADNTVESLLASPNFPDNPFRRDTLRAFDSRLVFPDDTQEGYGARISGVFIPPVSGNWRFFARVNELGVVNLNPNGTDEAGKKEILRQSTENAPFNWDRLSSSLIPLQAGRAYYIEGLYKGADGADFLKVAARLEGTGVPTPVDTLNTEVDANSLSGAIIAFPLAPRDLGGSLTIVQDLLDLTADENNPTTFTLQLDNPSRLPLQFQWFRDGTPILGANGPTYTIIPTIAGDNGASFSVQVAKVGSAVTSGTATLTVVPDTAGPQVVSASSSESDLTSVTVVFNEFVNTAEAEDSFTYDLGDLVSIFNAALAADGRTVTLTLGDPLVSGQTYQLQVSSIRDLAGNRIDPNPFTISFTAGGDLPRLSIVRSGGSVVLSWSASADGFVLQEATQFLDPVNTTAWTPVAGVPTVIDGTSNTLPVSIGSGNRVFRLTK